MNKIALYTFILIQVFCLSDILGQNPLVRDQFTADPSARVFGDRVYVYPSHDIMCTENKGRIGWFCMEDYHVFSSANLKDWTDHGMIVSQETVPWVKSDAYSMWAPDCIERNGKYYFYFPSKAQDTTLNDDGFSIGVAVSDKPAGPFVPQPEPIANVKGIDPNVLIDKDGQAYLYWSAGHIYGARLKENMLELASEPKILKDLPEKGLKEGPYVFEREGIYYMTYPHVENKTERLEYAIGDNPLGPFTYKGVIMDESPTGCWTNHHSIISYQDQWYLFYHHNDLSPDFDKNRSIRMDSLFFESDGTIRKVIPTLRGVGITKISEKIQIDRYSEISEKGAFIAFIDSLNTFAGWKVLLNKNNSWVKYNAVDFGEEGSGTVHIQAKAPKGGTVQLRLGSKDGPLIASVKVGKSVRWNSSKVKVQQKISAVKDLVMVLEGNNQVEIDWISFED